MRTTIYYFSGTGNTLAVAKRIADSTKAEIVSMSKVVCEHKITIDAEMIGIIFPCYLAAVSGVPLIVERVVRKIDNIADLTIFAVCNCGGYTSVNAWPSLDRLEKIIKSCSGRLHAAYSLRLPMNNLDYAHIPVPINKDSETIIRKSQAEVDRIVSWIQQGEKTRLMVLKRVFLHLIKTLNRVIQPSVMKELKFRAQEPEDSPLAYDELMMLTDRSIIVDENCSGCGICVRICPVSNISLVNKRPNFLHRCEICFACDEWCPAKAVHHWSRTKAAKYHHPDVSLEDMLNSNKINADAGNPSD